MFRIIPDGKTFQRIRAAARRGERPAARRHARRRAGRRGVRCGACLARACRCASWAPSPTWRAAPSSSCARASRATGSACSRSSDRSRDARVVGLGNYVSMGVFGKAEVAFLVHDEFQGRGISTLLLERLAGIAAGARVHRVRGRGPLREPGDDQRVPRLGLRGVPGLRGRQHSRRVPRQRAGVAPGAGRAARPDRRGQLARSAAAAAHRRGGRRIAGSRRPSAA